MRKRGRRTGRSYGSSRGRTSQVVSTNVRAMGRFPLQASIYRVSLPLTHMFTIDTTVTAGQNQGFGNTSINPFNLLPTEQAANYANYLDAMHRIYTRSQVKQARWRLSFAVEPRYSTAPAPAGTPNANTTPSLTIRVALMSRQQYNSISADSQLVNKAVAHAVGTKSVILCPTNGFRHTISGSATRDKWNGIMTGPMTAWTGESNDVDAGITNVVNWTADLPPALPDVIIQRSVSVNEPCLVISIDSSSNDLAMRLRVNLELYQDFVFSQLLPQINPADLPVSGL